MSAKTSQLQIRVTPDEKAALKGLAAAAGLSVSEYVLRRALPSARRGLAEAVNALIAASDRDGALDSLRAQLRDLSDERFVEAVSAPLETPLTPFLLNCVAASVEHECATRRLDPPRWIERIAPLSRPHFGRDLRSLRPFLMRVSPPAFKRRRVFIEADRASP
ncbi:MAG: DUF1778 domain-containing protein [Gemmatimonadota bacterium]|nr:DUF1778 domain-containing protein [Gemmatimonadota bacterium]MDH3423626.1 DUF1778 domain-containing protein [Gemmatimonadota bacterium]